MSLPKDLTPEALKVYDRQRFIGLDVQRRLLNSRVLLTPMTSLLTELAKNLVLCGCNLVLHDPALVSEEDIETNFLLSPAHKGLKKTEVIKQKFNDMNPMVSIEIIDSIEGIKEFDIIAIGTGDFNVMRKWEEINKEAQKPLYFMWNSGFYGFFYASLGKHCFRKEGETEDQNVKAVEFENTLKMPFGKRNKDVFLGIRMMAFAEENGFSISEISHKWGSFMEKYEKNQDYNKNKEQFLQQFAKIYQVEFPPVYSVVGSEASQEFIKVLGKNQEPGVGWFCYDSEEGYGRFEKN